MIVGFRAMISLPKGREEIPKCSILSYQPFISESIRENLSLLGRWVENNFLLVNFESFRLYSVQFDIGDVISSHIPASTLLGPSPKTGFQSVRGFGAE